MNENTKKVYLSYIIGGGGAMIIGFTIHPAGAVEFIYILSGIILVGVGGILQGSLKKNW